MTKISRFTLKHLSNGLHIAFHRGVLEFLDQQQPATEYLAEDLAAYRAAFEQERALFPYRLGSSITEQMAEAKRLRIELFVGLKCTVRAASCHWDETKREAARIMTRVINHYGVLYHQNMFEATANAGLLAKTSRNQYAQAVELLDLGEWLDRLEAANERFNTLFLDRSNEKGSMPKMRMIEARPALDKAYHNLAERINAYALVKDEAEFAHLIKFINAMIREEKLKLAQHMGRVRKKRRKELEQQPANSL